MHMIFYKSMFCLRCLYVSKVLKRLMREYSDLTVETVDIGQQPSRAWEVGIRLIPALQIQDERIASFLLTRKKIIAFIQKHQAGDFK